MAKFYPSNLDFAPNGLNLANFNRFCWRWVINTLGVKGSEIAQEYKDIGDIHERLLESRLAEMGASYDREVPFKLYLDGKAQGPDFIGPEDKHVVSGRCDFLGNDDIIECKATFNKQKYKAAPSREHLAQLVLYMGHWQKRHGKLFYGYYEKSVDGEFIPVDTKNIEVSLKDDGSVYVDSELYAYGLQDIAQALASLTRIYDDGIIPDVPWTDEAMSACKFCPAANACDNYKAGLTSDSDLKSAIRSAALTAETKPAKFTTQKPPKVPKTPKVGKSSTSKKGASKCPTKQKTTECQVLTSAAKSSSRQRKPKSSLPKAADSSPTSTLTSK